MKNLIGKTISHYHILEKQGEGGMGIVYKAEDIKLKRLVALKFLAPNLTHDKQAIQRFITEAQAASALDHQNVCTIYEIDEAEDGQIFIAMAYYEGETLQKKMAKGSVTSEEALDIAIQIGRGLSKAHRKKIVHRDIKPGNIIVQEDGTVKIIDFGLSKLLGQRDITKTGTTQGTVAYMSPEQAYGQKVDHRTDIWSLGVLLYEMLTGQKPFKGEYDQVIMFAIVHEEVTSLQQYCRNLPDALPRIVNKLLSKDPDERYQTMEDLISDLKNIHRLKSKIVTKPRHIQKETYYPKLLGLVVFGITLSLWLYSTYFKPGKVELESLSPDRIAVLPFDIHGGDELAFLRYGMIDLLSIKFDGAGDLHRIEPAAITRFINGKFDKVDISLKANDIARHFNARLYITGDIYEVNNQVQITASLNDVERGILTSVQTASSDRSNIFVLVDELGMRLIASNSELTGQRLQAVASVTTNSSVALKAYLNGEAYYRKGNYSKAIDAFKKATYEDSTFALAFFRIAVASSYEPVRYMEGEPAIKSAIRFRDKLPRKESMLLQAMQLKRQNKGYETENKLREIIDIYPDDVEAWNLLALWMFNFGARMGKTAEEMIATLNHALELNPENPILYGVFQSASCLDRKFSDMPIWADKRLLLAPDGTQSIHDRSISAFCRNDKPKQQEILELLKVSKAHTILFSSLYVAHTERYPEAEQIAHLLFDSSHSQYYQAHGYQVLMLCDLAQGKLSAAIKELEAAEKLEPGSYLLEETLMLLNPLVSERTILLRKQIEKMSFQKNNSDLSPILRHYALGLLYSRLGDSQIALNHADSLEFLSIELKNSQSPVMKITRSQDYAYSIRASIFLNSNKPEKALEELNRMKLENWWSPVPVFLFDTLVLERYMRGFALKSLKRYNEAIWWLGTLGYAHLPSLVYRAPAHYLLGEIYEELNQPDKAIENYTRVMELWQNCDPELQPTLERIKDRIKHLKH